jgi:hypothetical protein
VQPSCSAFPSLKNLAMQTLGLTRIAALDRYRMTGWDRTTEARVDVISGAAMFVRGAAMEEVGLLDEAFFSTARKPIGATASPGGVGVALCPDPRDHAFRRRCGGQAEPQARRADDAGHHAAAPQAWGAGRWADLFRDPCGAQRLARGAVGALSLLGNSGAPPARGTFARVVADLPQGMADSGGAGMKVL